MPEFVSSFFVSLLLFKITVKRLQFLMELAVRSALVGASTGIVPTYLGKIRTTSRSLEKKYNKNQTVCATVSSIFTRRQHTTMRPDFSIATRVRVWSVR